jgi:hypothetical protein
MGPIAGLDAVAKTEIPSPCLESNPERPARSLVVVPTEISGLLKRTYFHASREIRTDDLNARAVEDPKCLKP